MFNFKDKFASACRILHKFHNNKQKKKNKKKCSSPLSMKEWDPCSIGDLEHQIIVTWNFLERLQEVFVRYKICIN